LWWFVIVKRFRKKVNGNAHAYFWRFCWKLYGKRYGSGAEKMTRILSVGTWNPPYQVKQKDVMAFARELFRQDFDQIDRLLRVFQNGEIEERYFSQPLSWFRQSHSFEEKNQLYKQLAVEASVQAIERCLGNPAYLNEKIPPDLIHAIIFISSTGLSTPSIEVTVMNRLAFHPHTKRMPLWGLGCAGGTAGLSRADDYCQAYPTHAVLVVSVELCSLTFQIGDKSKSNLVGTSLFADGAACVLVCGDESPLLKRSRMPFLPRVLAQDSVLMPNSEDVMGWDIRNDGLFVIFAKSIPAIVGFWLKPVLERFLNTYKMSVTELQYFIAHPGGRKVLEAYRDALNLHGKILEDATEILRKYGNMSSPTVLFVLDRVMKKEKRQGEKGMAVSLGPGFSAELLLMEWGLGT
jgi:alkylresorcinol/alkylpyrone synthase